MAQLINEPVGGFAQRVDEWAKLDPIALDYHLKQWRTPKRSTIAFERFIAPLLENTAHVVDLACGGGAATAQIAEQHPATSFCGQDYLSDLVAMAAQLSNQLGLSNLRFEQADWFDLPATDAFDGVISLQTLSWLPEFERPLAEIFTKLRPRWLGLTSLFYDGEISCRIEVNELRRETKSFYNVYALPEVDRFCRAHGYHVARVEPFAIDIDIDPPTDRNVMGTYTRRLLLADGSGGFERMQLSGPLWMNWYMVLIERP